LFFDCFILAVLAALAWSIFAPEIGPSWFQPIERFATGFARRKQLVLMTVAATAILARIALLSVLPIPVPHIHDEFSYLLASDTFAHGRLANPTHPMWKFFDTFHILQTPTYASKFPPAQGAVLALGQLLGNPWIGVLLSMSAMCVAITWMLQGWFPSKWALLGAVLVLAHLYLFNNWLESYIGGAVAAVGGALVIGALPRIFRHQRTIDAVAMAVGAALLANSRPLEGLLFCIPVAIGLFAWLFSKQSPPLRTIVWRVCLPIVTILVATLAFMGYYDWRVTGNVFVHPHMLYDREYVNYPLFVWQTVKPALKYSNPQFESFFNGWVRNAPVQYSPWSKCQIFWQFFLGSVLSTPFVTLPWMIRDRRIRLLLLQFSFCALCLLAVVWFLPPYAAPLTATVIALLVQAMRHLRRWQFKGRPVGVFLTRLVVLLLLVRVPIHIWQLRIPDDRWGWSRNRIATQLRSMPGEQLVIVRYSLDHNSLHEWVYNAADIDHSKIVWAREIPGLDPNPLLEYFRGRNVWLVEADASWVQLQPYESAPKARQNGPPSP
jgi:hypothetical protein